MQNSYNCPIVTGYSQVIRSVQAGAVPIDSPTVSFKDKAALRRQCEEYLTGLGVPASVVRQAVRQAYDAQEHYEREITEYNESVLTEARKKGRLAIMLAGRPYHADPLIQHKVSEMIAAQGAIRPDRRSGTQKRHRAVRRQLPLPMVLSEPHHEVRRMGLPNGRGGAVHAADIVRMRAGCLHDG